MIDPEAESFGRSHPMPAHLVRCPKALLLAPLGPHAWQARLPNGHDLIAILRRAHAHLAPFLTVGSCVTLSLSPQDFSQGWIVDSESAAAADDQPAAESANLSGPSVCQRG